ncbi:VanZ family protein [Paenibacillus sp. UNC451MF]|uniref:VanZ family protein n=1 Tax=Paenibacillus sp. UNC451MF TaxID=1449063 RepID=UPI000689C208|nr:VanZ family protein [Paenibacillus sp. UNC451MF]
MKRIHRGKDVLVLPVLFAIYLYLLIKVILFKFGPIEVDYLMDRLQKNWHNPNDILQRFHAAGNITLFKEIARDLNHTPDLLQFPPGNLVGNIEAFIPLGILAPMVFSGLRRTWMGMFLVSFFLSFGFEVIQLLLSIGTFDVDDILLNVTGGMLGYAVLRLFAVRRRTGHQAEQKKEDFSRQLKSIKE